MSSNTKGVGLNTVGIIDIEQHLKDFYGNVVGGRLHCGEKFSGRLLAYDSVYLKLENRNGKIIIVRRSEIDVLWGV
jgi:hypothetical protein